MKRALPRPASAKTDGAQEDVAQPSHSRHRKTVQPTGPLKSVQPAATSGGSAPRCIKSKFNAHTKKTWNLRNLKNLRNLRNLKHLRGWYGGSGNMKFFPLKRAGCTQARASKVVPKAFSSLATSCLSGAENFLICTDPEATDHSLQVSSESHRSPPVSALCLPRG